MERGVKLTVMEMALYVTLDNTTQCPHKIVHLSWTSTANCVCDTNSPNASLGNN